MNRALKYGAVLIGLYIVTANATNFGKNLTAGGSALSSVTKTLQGR